MEERKIPIKVAESLVSALNSGTTPRRGLEFITVGRSKEIKVLVNDLQFVKDGGSTFKFIVGEYGSGKSFMLQAIRNYALENDFVVMDVDLGPDKRFRGTGNKGLATYRALMESIAIKTKAMGGALDSLLVKWLSKLQRECVEEEDIDTANPHSKPYLQEQVNRKISEVILNMQSRMFEYDFIDIMKIYWDGLLNQDDIKKRNAAKWFRGEYTTKREVTMALGVTNLITDDNWYSFLKLWAEFVTSIGYSGLVVFFDEAKTLANVASASGRNANYEAVLSIFNDTVQGRASHLFILMGGTDEFIQDERRGLFSYAALRSRLEDGWFTEQNGYRNWDAPLMPIKVLSHEEIYTLMQKLREIHGIRYKYEPRVTDQNLMDLLQATVDRVGANTNLTAREVTRNTMNVLGALYHNPEARFEDIMQDNIRAPENEEDDFLQDD